MDDTTSAERARYSARAPIWRYWFPLGFVIASLLMLAVVPPLWQARIEESRRTIAERLEPARDEVLGMLLEFGREVAMVRSYIATGDRAWLEELERTSPTIPGALARVRALTGEEMPAVTAAIDSTEQAYRAWRALTRTLATGEVPPRDTAGWLGTATARTDQTYEAVNRLRTALIDTQNSIRARTFIMGRLGVAVTVVLALFSLASVVLVVRIGRRLTRLVILERTARSQAETRAREEWALRNAIGAVATTYTVQDVIQRIAEAAVLATGANAAIVTRIHLGRNELEVVAASGEPLPGVGQRMRYPGSVAERAISRGAPDLTDALYAWRDQLPREIVDTCPDCPALLVPLVDAGEAVGTLLVIGTPDGAPSRPDQIERAHAFGNLAAIAIRKVHMFEDSERRREALLRVTESRARLVRGFSHDVKNPLGAADGYLQLLIGDVFGETTEPQKEALGNARRSIGEALQLIDNLLALARAETAEIEIQRVPTDVGEAAREMTEEYRAQAEAKGLAIEVETPSELPLIESDASRIRQVLGNLLSNAVKYTESGVISVRVREVTTDCADGGPCIEVEVSDTGPGIPPELHDIIFDEFARADTGGIPGTGVGLAISRRICEALGGTLTADSQPGQGATFRLVLPAPRPQGDASIPAAA